MDRKQMVLFEEVKDCLEDFSGVVGDGLGEGEVISFDDLEERWDKEEGWLPEISIG